MRVALLMVLSLFVSGCAVAGYAAAVAAGPTKVDAKFLPASRPTAIVVDSYRTKVPISSFRDSLASLLARELAEHHVVPLIESYKVYDLRQRDPNAFREMRVDAIGRAVGAEQVIYIDILDADMTSTVGNQLTKGGVTAAIKVIDCKTGQTLWPKGFDEGYPYSIETKYTSPDSQESNDAIQESVARQAAGEIARLFYKYSLDD